MHQNLLTASKSFRSVLPCCHNIPHTPISIMVNTRRSLGSEPLSPGLPYYSTPTRNQRAATAAPTAPSTAPPAVRDDTSTAANRSEAATATGYQTLPDRSSSSSSNSNPGRRSTTTTRTNTQTFGRQQSRLRRSAPAKSTTQVYLAYDDRTMLHGAPDGHPDARNECPRRVEVIKERLEELEEDLGQHDDEWCCSAYHGLLRSSRH